MQNLVSKVRFSDGLQLLVEDMQKMSDEQECVFVEIGPAAALAGSAKQTMSSMNFKPTYLSALSRNSNACVTLLSLLGRLIEMGHPVDMEAVSKIGPHQVPHKSQVVSDLPSYPFDTSSHWAESRVSAAHRFRRFPYPDLCGIFDPLSSLLEPRWRHMLNLDALPWLKDHVIGGNAVFPASGYVVMVVEAMKQLQQLQETPGIARKFVLHDIMLLQPKSLSIDEQDSDIKLQLAINPSKAGLRWKDFRISSFDKASNRWYENCNGLIAVENAVQSDDVEEKSEDEIRAQAQLARSRSYNLSRRMNSVETPSMKSSGSLEIITAELFLF